MVFSPCSFTLSVIVEAHALSTELSVSFIPHQIQNRFPLSHVSPLAAFGSVVSPVTPFSVISRTLSFSFSPRQLFSSLKANSLIPDHYIIYYQPVCLVVCTSPICNIVLILPLTSSYFASDAPPESF